MFRFLLIAILVFGLAGTAAGEFYRYRDANGVTRFTDNIMEVPADQRPAIKSYTEPDDDLTPEEKAQKTRKDEALRQKQELKARQTKQVRQLESADITSPAGLQEMKAALDREYDGLLREKRTLDDQQARMKSNTELRRWREEVRELNQRIADFEVRRTAFKKKVDSLNTAPGRGD